MKKIYFLSICSALILTLFLSGCKKDGSSASSSQQIAFQVQSDNPITTFGTTNNTNNGIVTFGPVIGTASVTWTGAVANISKFKFDAKKDGTAFELLANGLSNVDLFALNPSVIHSYIPNGTYKEVKLSLVLSKSSTTAYPLVLKGTFTTKAGTGIPIAFDFNEDVEITASANDMVVDGTKNIVAAISLHLNKLLANVSAAEIDAATRTNNVILINSTVNAALYAKIKADLLLSGGSNFIITIK